MTIDEIDEALGGAEVVFQASYDELLEKVADLIATAERECAEKLVTKLDVVDTGNSNG